MVRTFIAAATMVPHAQHRRRAGRRGRSTWWKFCAPAARSTPSGASWGALERILGQQVIIENVGGAGGMTGAARVAKATTATRW